jgi:glycosyltransferase involved in cell wall biosynthesis
MACETPVVASNSSAIPEVVGDAAISVDPHDIPAMARALERIRDDKVQRDKLVARGVERVGLFSWEKTARMTLDCYERAVK